MTTTQSLLDVLPRVARLNDIKIFKPKDTSDVESIARLWGCDESVVSGNLDRTKAWFLTRFDVYFLINIPTRYSAGTTNTFHFGVIANTLEEIPELISTLLDVKTEYFRTFTDEWGRTYGEKE